MPATSSSLACDATAAYLVAGGTAQLRWRSSGSEPVWMALEETGRDVEVVAQPSERLDVPIPPRYGTLLIAVPPEGRLEVRRTDGAPTAASVRVTLHCTPNRSFDTELTWFRQAAPLATRAAFPQSATAMTALRTDLQHLQWQAPDPRAHALALHLRAQAEFMSGRSLAATDAFASAEVAWRAAGDTRRASAAKAGRIEDLLRAARYHEVVELTQATSRYNEYFSLRQQNSRCIALNYLGQLMQAKACYESLIPGFETAGELTDAMNSMVNFATVQQHLGDDAAAETSLRKASAFKQGPYAGIVRGRARLGLIDLELARGRIVDALRESDRAIEDFKTDNLLLWQVNALLKTASIYRELGAYDEAYAAITQALTRLPAKDNPSRVAAALLALSAVDARNHRSDEALDWSSAAERIYATLKQPAELELARLASIGLRLERGEAEAVVDALATVAAGDPVNAKRQSLLVAEATLRRGRLDQARELLDALIDQPNGLSDRIRLAQLEADYWRARGDAARAVAVLRTTMRAVHALARTTDDRLLRMLIERRDKELIITAIRLLLDPALMPPELEPSNSTDARAAQAWQWLARTTGTETSSQRFLASSNGGASRFDAAIGAELLGSAISSRGMPPESGARDQLLVLLAQASASEPGALAVEAGPQLVDLQAQLDGDTAFLAWLDGGDLAGALYVTAGSARVLDSGPPSVLRAAASVLRNSLRSAATPMRDIEAAARRASDLLWGSVGPGTPAPHTLLVLADSELDAIPWSVLPWPGSGQSLLDTTSIRFVRIAAEQTGVPTSNKPRLHAIVASQQQSDQPALPALDGANAEAALIESVVDRQVIVAQTEAATRSTVLAAMDEPGAWVHIAAHAMAQPGRIGYAGLWLDPPKTNASPEFLSWLDILQRGVRAELVVLNACQLGDSGRAISGNLSFASAVSRAGAQQVVAAMWPVSDAAAAIWVPAFYSVLTADPKHDAAAALRIAQLKLRDSRAFRHPFYWAGLQAFARVALGDQALRQPPVGVVAAHD